ncbi:hypothetical protein METBIDRAFT_38153 [Metschnikowia bicuspidata var. bicuspidata NRRL YB-4993]|uniref:U3 small nucleolar RNA-associated protein 10 n=1 Tax=Metschnikowia bicuspidata var. bicuspidata NRRL YB-4993 TaxID=869754 RepID=A0A1A0HFI6_9ASCO|nr:hypothetical protein METBIDRAFT_38153 [Metschnikowia bicuspidata var. bicuspidata NRRL YB-4993]OBA22662.1 hypothetical protein METBIDRAFT_38153 [Metschnikowia bicuspidata var. bicuspidata NRRL YB-4993]
MSSLSQQLQAISAKNASVALDRKSRAYVHSQSLIFDPKVAAAQDFDYIHQIACEGLEELVQIEPRFARFSQTLFLEASVTFDRNVLLKDVVAQAEKNAVAFINMAAPYFALSPALKAMEWLVRRYHVNIHHPEPLLLAALPYHNKPVFTRFMAVVPKSLWPAIFSPIAGYKETLAIPPLLSILKCFYNDAAFFRLYSQYVVDALKNSTVYKEQLVFYLSNTAQVLASHARDTARLNEQYIPVILETAAEFFRDRTFRYSATLAQDVRLTIYAILSVLCSLVPLLEPLVFSLTKSVLQSEMAFAPALQRHTLILLGQLWHFYNEHDLPKDTAVFADLPVCELLQHELLVHSLADDHYHLLKFLFFFLADKINQSDADAAKVLPLLQPEGSRFLFDSLATKLLAALDTPFAHELKPRVVDAFERLVKCDRNRLLAILDAQNKTLADLEMALLRTLTDADVNASVYEADYLKIAVEGPADDHVKASFASHASTRKSFLSSDSSDDFALLVLVLLDSMHHAEVVEQIQNVFAFVDAVVTDGAEAQCSFLLRVALTPAVPSNMRLVALKCLLTKIDDAAQANSKHAFYLLAPLLLLALGDPSKIIRGYVMKLLEQIKVLSAQLIERSGKKVKCTLFMETQIYGDLEPAQRSIISPQDGNAMLQALFEHREQTSSVLVDPARIQQLLFDGLFKASKTGLKKFGPVLLRTFVLNQWSLTALPLAVKHRVWQIVAARNVALEGSDDRFVFAEDLKTFFAKTAAWQAEAQAAKIAFEDVEDAVVNMVGGKTASEQNTAKEVKWFLQALSSQGSLQSAANKRLIEIFPRLEANEHKLKICNELVDLIVTDNDAELAFDPMETLQTVVFSNLSMIALLNTVNIVTLVPEQGMAKRRRRSSSSTQKTMARDDISSIAAHHLRKLSVILDVLESQLRRNASQLANPDLLQEMFKILTDLDYLCNDGKMPVLYAQETLASCMLLTIVDMKKPTSRTKFKFDSNSIRADLIVNSIRLSQSPQVQNRLLLVISELASLAPEIILHSVMPIFTFMGAHTIRQDDEFSSSALQQTIAKVVPAITSASQSIDSEIEFLLTSFITAFQHIPRHRRVKLFVSLVKTLGCKQSLHTILFLIGQQYAASMAKHKAHECDSLLDFVTSLLKTFPADDCLQGLYGFYQLWDAIPTHALDKDSEQFAHMSGRSIYGASVVSLPSKDLVVLKFRLLRFLNKTLAADEDTAFSSSVVSLKMKVALTLFDDESEQKDKDALLRLTSRLTSFILTALEAYTSSAEAGGAEVVEELYELLKSVLNLLPLSHYMLSIIESLRHVTDATSIKVAKNFAILAGQRFESEVTKAALDEHVDSVVAEKLLPALVEGVEQFHNTELVQAYLDTFATVINKFGATNPDFASSTHAKFLVGSLRVITSHKGLLSEQVEVVVSSLGAITSVVNCLGVKCIGHFPKILPPALEIWKLTLSQRPAASSDSEDESDAELADSEEAERDQLLQGAVLMLFSCLVKRMPAFVSASLIAMIRAVLQSDLVDSSIRAGVLGLMVEHIDGAQVLQAMCNMALTEHVYELDSAVGLGLYLNGMSSAIDSCDKKTVTGNSALFMRWMIKSFEFRSEHGEAKFSDNTVHSIEGSFHACGLKYVMKLNDKNFRPLFASLVRWAVSGESGSAAECDRETRLLSFFKFFGKLQDNLRGIITSYFSYLLDATVQLLTEFQTGQVANTSLRRIVLHSLASSFKYDQDDYWTHQSRFDLVAEPLVGQLHNIEDSIGKHLVKAISFFVADVASDEHNEKLVQAFIRHISNEHDNSSATKIWTVRVMKTVLQKMGEQWLAYLPMFIPYIAELLEDDDEAVEMEVRKDLVRVIESILGEPLDRYLS